MRPKFIKIDGKYINIEAIACFYSGTNKGTTVIQFSGDLDNDIGVKATPEVVHNHIFMALSAGN